MSPELTTVKETATLPKVVFLVNNSKTAESVPLDDVPLGVASSGTPVQPWVELANSEPEGVGDFFIEGGAASSFRCNWVMQTRESSDQSKISSKTLG